MLRYAQHFRAHLSQLIQLMDAGELKVRCHARQPDGVKWMFGERSLLPGTGPWRSPAGKVWAWQRGGSAAGTSAAALVRRLAA